MALENFLLGPEVDLQRENALAPGEILTAVLLPAPKPGVRSFHLRQGELDSFDWPIAAVAVVLELGRDGAFRRAGVVLGGGGARGSGCFPADAPPGKNPTPWPSS